MIKILRTTVKEDLPEMTVNFEDAKYFKFLPTCPQCNLIDNVLISNVTKAIYECTGCHLRFRIARKSGLAVWKRD
jgi:hypothetical protein